MFKMIKQITRAIAEDFLPRDLSRAVATIPNWQGLLNELELHALAPLFYRLACEHQLVLPGSAKPGLQALVMRHRAAADSRYTAISDLSQRYHQFDVPFVVLKGLGLTAEIYHLDELRPMRDMDILVPVSQLSQAKALAIESGFNLPDTHPSKFMRDTHQLPNATKQINGFQISLEIHHDAIPRDVPGHLRYEDVEANIRQINWRSLNLPVLGVEQNLCQIMAHLAGLHPQGVLKMINVLDVVWFAEHHEQKIDWQRISKHYPLAINTLRCLHQITPLSTRLQRCLGEVSDITLNGTGESMLPLSEIFKMDNSMFVKLKKLFCPSVWWRHLYYNIPPDKSLFLVNCVRHPLTLLRWFGQRMVSAIRGG